MSLFSCGWGSSGTWDFLCKNGTLCVSQESQDKSNTNEGYFRKIENIQTKMELEKMAQELRVLAALLKEKVQF